MATVTETLVEELDAWEKAIKKSARQIARQILVSQLGPVVLMPVIDEEDYTLQIESLSSSFHSN